MDACAATFFAAAIGFAIHAALASTVSVAASGSLAFAVCLAGLRKVAPKAQRCEVPEAIAGGAATPITALLTEADRVMSEAQPDVGQLTLDDVLAEIGPGSRVVRLFDPTAMPTPGEQARIDKHIGDGRSSCESADASQALLDALAELRRSLH